MTGREGAERRWSVGEPARATGLTVLARPADDVSALRAVLVGQPAHLDEQASRVARPRAQIGGLLSRLDTSGMPGPEHLTTTLEMISMLDDHYTRERQDVLAERRAAPGEGPDLVDYVKRAREARA